MKKKLDGNYTRMLCDVLNKSLKQSPTEHKLYGHLPPVSQNIKVRRARHVGEVKANSQVTLSDELLLMDTPVLVDQQKLIFHSSVKAMPREITDHSG